MKNDILLRIHLFHNPTFIHIQIFPAYCSQKGEKCAAEKKKSTRRPHPSCEFISKAFRESPLRGKCIPMVWKLKHEEKCSLTILFWRCLACSAALRWLLLFVVAAREVRNRMFNERANETLLRRGFKSL